MEESRGGRVSSVTDLPTVEESRGGRAAGCAAGLPAALKYHWQPFRLAKVRAAGNT